MSRDRTIVVFNMNSDSITIKGARQNYLKNIDVAIPRNRLVVITGISGSYIIK